jgi:hypothetical protein
MCIEAGASGLIFGRNMWQRPSREGLKITDGLRHILFSFDCRTDCFGQWIGMRLDAMDIDRSLPAAVVTGLEWRWFR